MKLIHYVKYKYHMFWAKYHERQCYRLMEQIKLACDFKYGTDNSSRDK